MTIRLAHDVGMNKVVEYPIRMGVYDKLPAYLSNSIGAYETTLIRLTAGYAQFVNGGRKVTPKLMDRIQDRNGKTVYREDPRACDGCNAWNWHGQAEPLLPDTRAQTLDPRTAYQIVSLLQGVVQYGTGKTVSAVGKPLAGKTGTSNDSKDTWFVGFSPDLVCGVFVGFDDPRTLGRVEQGATTAAPIFRNFMKEALADEPPIPFRVPPGIVLVSVDRITGAPESASAPTAIPEAFKSGTEPGSASYLEQTAVQSQETKATGPGTTVDQGTGGLY
jgi:penicillin-binding protein 1A